MSPRRPKKARPKKPTRKRQPIDPRDVGLSEVLFEFAKVGKYLRINAIDPKTGTEVTMMGDPKQGQELLKRIGMQKLAYVLAKKRGLLDKRDDDGVDEIA